MDSSGDEEETEAILNASNIELSVIDTEQNDSENNEVTNDDEACFVDGPTTYVDGPGGIASPRELFTDGNGIFAKLFRHERSNNGSRRSSYRSSTTSIDTVYLREIKKHDRSVRF